MTPTPTASLGDVVAAVESLRTDVAMDNAALQLQGYAISYTLLAVALILVCLLSLLVLRVIQGLFR